MFHYKSGEKSKQGLIRYRCTRCGKTYTKSKKKTWKKKLRIVWLEKYILGGLIYEQLAAWAGCTIRSLETQLHTLLLQDPPELKLPEITNDESYLLIDGLWFGKRSCLMLYRHSKRKMILHLSFLKREYGSQIARDLKLLQKTYRFTGVVSDGGRGIVAAVFHVFGHIPHQICMAHLHRDVVNAMGRFPKDERVKELKRIADHIWRIESKEALRWWQDWLQSWITKNRDFLYERRHIEGIGWWYVHKGVRKAVRVLTSLPDTSFQFLTHPLMPKTSNELEGSISVLSRKHQLHKGLKRERVNAFIQWFVYFYNKKLLSQRKN